MEFKRVIFLAGSVVCVSVYEPSYLLETFLISCHQINKISLSLIQWIKQGWWGGAHNWVYFNVLKLVVVVVFLIKNDIYLSENYIYFYNLISNRVWVSWPQNKNENENKIKHFSFFVFDMFDELSLRFVKFVVVVVKLLGK